MVGPIDRRFVGFLLLGYSVVCTFESLLCFVFFLYLDLYVLGDDTLLSKGSFMRTTLTRVLIHFRIKGEFGTVKYVKALQYFLLRTVSRNCFFLCFVFVFVILSCLFLSAL